MGRPRRSMRTRGRSTATMMILIMGTERQGRVRREHGRRKSSLCSVSALEHLKTHEHLTMAQNRFTPRSSLIIGPWLGNDDLHKSGHATKDWPWPLLPA